MGDDDHRPNDRSSRVAQDLFAPLPARYERLAEVLSFGQNGRWQAGLVDALVPPGASPPGTVLDVATGTGAVATRLTQRCPAAQVVGLDLTEQMLHEARRRLVSRGRAVRLVTGSAERLPFADATFDALSVTYLLRYVTDPAATIHELVRVVRPGGRVASMEFAVPTAPWWRAAWEVYVRLGLPAAGAATGGAAWWRVGRFLGPSIRNHYRDYPVDWTVRAWRDAGLEDVVARPMSLGGGIVFSGRRGDG
ncbi:MAG: methyltransferase domain-containing protein [Propionibacteriales bacterium]|nr:methyltransferase domain-containing protein [Propionibacteriales bacterium]